MYRYIEIQRVEYQERQAQRRAEQKAREREMWLERKAERDDDELLALLNES